MFENKRIRSNSRIQLIRKNQESSFRMNNSPIMKSGDKFIDMPEVSECNSETSAKTGLNPVLPEISLDLSVNNDDNHKQIRYNNFIKFLFSYNLIESNYYSYMLIVFIYYCFGFLYNYPNIHYFEIQHQLFFITNSYYYLSNGSKYINKKYWNIFNISLQIISYISIEYLVSLSLLENIILTEDYIKNWNFFEWIFIICLILFIYFPIVLYFMYQAYITKQLFLFSLSPIVFCSYILFSKFILLEETYSIHIHHYIIAYLIGINARYNTFISRSIHSICFGILLQGIIKYNADPIFE
jgi:hypothetical protein